MIAVVFAIFGGRYFLTSCGSRSTESQYDLYPRVHSANRAGTSKIRHKRRVISHSFIAARNFIAGYKIKVFGMESVREIKRVYPGIQLRVGTCPLGSGILWLQLSIRLQRSYPFNIRRSTRPRAKSR